MPSRSQSAITTYRALRMGVVAVALLLMVSLVLEIIRTGGLELTSISASFYSPYGGVEGGADRRQLQAARTDDLEDERHHQEQRHRDDAHPQRAVRGDRRLASTRHIDSSGTVGKCRQRCRARYRRTV